MDLNKVMLIGRITTDIELKKIGENGVSVVNFNIATNRRYKNSEGNTIEEAEFHKCVAFGGLADIIGNYAEKGKKVYLEGRLKTKKWEDTNGNNRYTTEIVSDNVILLDGKSGQGLNKGNSSNNENKDDEDLPF
ncbi:single-stranded DNA-binding protein [Candidatus Vampirococcus lugosii]|nr:single-stranded DNA-binding protein [Candidatus Vampirococcus lugosii]